MSFIAGSNGIVLGGGDFGFIYPSQEAAATLENVESLSGYSPKIGYYLNISPPNGIKSLPSNQLLFNPGAPIQIYKTKDIQAIYADIELLSAGNVLVGLYKYDYPNEQFVKAAEWGGAIATGRIKYTLAAPLQITPGTYFTCITVSSGSARIRYSNSTNYHVEYKVPNQAYESTVSLVNDMYYTFPSFPVTTLPATIRQVDMSIGYTATPIFPPNLVF